MKLEEIEERLREIIDAHSEDERGVIIDADGLLDDVDELAREIERARIVGAETIAC